MFIHGFYLIFAFEVKKATNQQKKNQRLTWWWHTGFRGQSSCSYTCCLPGRRCEGGSHTGPANGQISNQLWINLQPMQAVNFKSDNFVLFLRWYNCSVFQRSLYCPASNPLAIVAHTVWWTRALRFLFWLQTKRQKKKKNASCSCKYLSNQQMTAILLPENGSHKLWHFLQLC